MADLSVTAGSVVFSSGTKITGEAGEAVTAGQVVYLKSSDNQLYLAQRDGTAAEAAVVGVALNAAGDNQPLVYAATGSILNIGATTAKTTTYMVGAAAGGISPQADVSTAGHYIVRVGYATATDGTFVVDIKNTGATV
jgi:hypothetical protein